MNRLCLCEALVDGFCQFKIVRCRCIDDNVNFSRSILDEGEVFMRGLADYLAHDFSRVSTAIIGQAVVDAHWDFLSMESLGDDFR